MSHRPTFLSVIRKDWPRIVLPFALGYATCFFVSFVLESGFAYVQLGCLALLIGMIAAFVQHFRNVNSRYSTPTH